MPPIQGVGVLNTNTTKFHIGETSPLPIIQVQINNKTFNALLDSGTSISIISNKAFQKLPPSQITNKPNPQVKITTLSGDEIQINSSALLSVSLANTLFKHNFLCTQTNFGRDYDLILGFDFLTSFNCTVNFEKQIVSFLGGKKPIFKYAVNQINVLHFDIIGRLAKKIKQPPNSSTIAKVKIDHKISPGTNILLTPLKSQYNVEIHTSLGTVDNDGTVPLLINNLSHTPLHFNKNTKIANIESDIDIHKNESLQRQRSEELREEQFDFTNIPFNAKPKLLSLLFEYADIFSTSLKTIGKCTLEAPPIEITDNQPIQCRPFPVPVALRDSLKQ